MPRGRDPRCGAPAFGDVELWITTRPTRLKVASPTLSSADDLDGDSMAFELFKLSE